ncbi:MAG: hypothetical protein IJZ39_02670 [Oscillospiraceae bacterium]|nr:hypothetical protein [Oscillospiraceae bacterium]
MNVRDDYCVFYQVRCDNLTDAQLNYCADCGLACHRCGQCIDGGGLL